MEMETIVLKMTRNHRTRSSIIKEDEARVKDKEIQKFIENYQTQETMDEHQAHTNQVDET
jgi:hypothetical protein